jgi:preprotein translocase subunit Sss1
MKFFEAKDVVQRAASKPKTGFAGSDTAQAFETVMHAKMLNDAERELNNWMVMSGHADTWQQLLIERNNIIQKRKAQEILDEKNAAAKKKELDEFINWLLGGAIVILVLGLILWWLTMLLEKH